MQSPFCIVYIFSISCNKKKNLTKLEYRICEGIYDVLVPLKLSHQDKTEDMIIDHLI
jgi:hypothetical protein